MIQEDHILTLTHYYILKMIDILWSCQAENDRRKIPDLHRSSVFKQSETNVIHLMV